MTGDPVQPVPEPRADECSQADLLDRVPLRPLLPSRRELKSDLLLVKPPRESRYVEYRDVFKVDGAAVRDRRTTHHAASK